MIKLLSFIAFELLVVLLLAFINKKYFNYKLSNFKIAVISSFFFYISILAIVFVINYTLKNELDSFDLNGDNNFSIDERTLEQQQVMKAIISDTGRNLAPILGIIYSLIYFTIIIIPLNIFNKKKNKSTN
ncbi:hypothetical protein ACFX5F_15505 [Flavobacterium sp. ZS1P70]|uniref:DUF4199 domain-containing protein n=1 Tax=Flavobacterium zhoui TaxID=3230414 RepID=A0ABW6I8K5_9FLAO